MNLKNFIQKAKDWPHWKKPEVRYGIAAIGLGIISSILAQMHESAREDELRSAYSTRSIYVATVDIGSGSFLTRDNIELRPYLSANVNSNNVNERGLDLALGRQTLVELRAGDPILLTSLGTAGDSQDIAEKIPPGKRLFNLPVDDAGASSGFVRPNQHVDIFAHMELPNRGSTTFKIVEDVTLIAVGKTSIIKRSESDTSATVSFFVDSKDAETLAFASKRGTFSISLRNPKDIERQTNSRGVDLNDFLDADLVQKASGGGKLQVTSNGKNLDNEDKKL